MYLMVLKQKEGFGLRFWRLNDRENCTIYVFGSYKLTRMLCQVYIDVEIAAVVPFSNETARNW